MHFKYRFNYLTSTRKLLYHKIKRPLNECRREKSFDFLSDYLSRMCTCFLNIVVLTLLHVSLLCLVDSKRGPCIQ